MTFIVHQAHIPPMTKLDAWMSDRRDDQWLANALGCSRSQASRIRRGKSMPSLDTAVAIERLTKGKVKPADLLVGAVPPSSANDAPATASAA